MSDHKEWLWIEPDPITLGLYSLTDIDEMPLGLTVTADSVAPSGTALLTDNGRQARYGAARITWAQLAQWS